MLRPASIDAIQQSPYHTVNKDETEIELSGYSDENDTSNLSKFYNYETSEDVDGNLGKSQQRECCPEINKALVVYKSFYFLFFGAVGALFPYLAVFYKQLWLSPHQVGILIGLRPFIQMCASPFWGVIADTYNASKWILLMSIGAWLVSNYSISYVKPKRYEQDCSLNLTYLPLSDGVDDQDFNWVRIEPLVSKKANITEDNHKVQSWHGIENDADRKKYNYDNKYNYNNKYNDANEPYKEETMIDDVYDDSKIYKYEERMNDDDDVDENEPVYRKNKVERGRKVVPKNQAFSLFAILKRNKTGETRGDEDKGNSYKNRQIEMQKRMNRDNTSTTKTQNKIHNKATIMTLLKTMFRVKRKSTDKTNLKNFDEQAFLNSGSNESMADAAISDRKSNASHLPINNVTWKIITTKDRYVVTSKTVTREDRNADYEEEMNNDEPDKDEDKLNKEESDEYVQDVLSNDQKGEFFAESILPNQRVLAKDNLREEFDSLRSPGKLFWPIDTKSDVRNVSSDGENVEQSSETKNIFNILLAITICGTVLSSPAATLADTATLQALGDDKYRYGQQRLWGAFGWGLGAFIVGAVVSLIQEIQPCADPKHIDYILSFYVYAVVMVLAFICSLFFHFEAVSETSYKESFWDAVKLFVDCQHICFIMTLLCSGTAMGFTHTFLFWHLHDMGGSQFLFSIIAAVQCISEVFMYFVSGHLILKIGCDSVLYIGLLANVLRLFAYSVISQPIFAVFLEVLQGISSASIWTAAIYYVGLNDGVQVTLQAMLHGIYWGLGHGGGGMLGGLIVGYMGSNATFIIFGICCIINLATLFIMKYWRKFIEFVGGYTSVETIPTGTYILVEQRAERR